MKAGILGVIGRPRVICGDIGLTENICDGGREMVPGAGGRRESDPIRPLLPFDKSDAREVDFAKRLGPAMEFSAGTAGDPTVDGVDPSSSSRSGVDSAAMPGRRGFDSPPERGGGGW